MPDYSHLMHVLLSITYSVVVFNCLYYLITHIPLALPLWVIYLSFYHGHSFQDWLVLPIPSTYFHTFFPIFCITENIEEVVMGFQFMGILHFLKFSLCCLLCSYNSKKLASSLNYYFLFFHSDTKMIHYSDYLTGTPPTLGQDWISLTSILIKIIKLQILHVHFLSTMV